MNIAPGRLFFTRILFISFAVSLLFFSAVSFAHAGFGITPPYVQNDRLTRGTVYEQRINLVRSEAADDLKVEVSMNIPGVEQWFSVDRGREFILPAGAKQMPIVIQVQVPEDAEYKEYKGTIRIRTSSASAPEGGGVSIALGAQVDVDIKVVDQIYDFDVRKIRMVDLEEGRTKWGLFFPGKIRLFMTIENTGNTVFGPTKVVFEIYDNEMETLLETVENTNDIERIDPFAIKEIVAELPTRLSAGRYKAKYTIYKNDDIAQQSILNLSVAALGAVPGYEGYGFDGLSFEDKMKVAGVLGVPVALLLVLIAVLILKRNRRKRPQTPHVFSSRIQ